MTEQVLDVCRTKDVASIKLVHYASMIKEQRVASFMGVKLREVQGAWQIVLVDRREK
jgi:hypothetical protein